MSYYLIQRLNEFCLIKRFGFQLAAPIFISRFVLRDLCVLCKSQCDKTHEFSDEIRNFLNNSYCSSFLSEWTLFILFFKNWKYKYSKMIIMKLIHFHLTLFLLWRGSIWPPPPCSFFYITQKVLVWGCWNFLTFPIYPKPTL